MVNQAASTNKSLSPQEVRPGGKNKNILVQQKKQKFAKMLNNGFKLYPSNKN
eukprot:CAMPEP_0170511376 /NCGR_PEP_ID=MMETSP0208-20121228/66274_1 /TAXON_ID=197538 /ORGANISM="Strombidium inclinatum, Strain S3" /LENGTH=51 /DNA_ID=CAMNT_0010794913 /DNA_START=838 /DNA_END=993 /DNA_ORIENTATION=-